MPIDHRLINLIVCPVCKGPLEMVRDADGRPTAMSCHADRLAFDIRDGIPVLIEHEAHSFDPDAATTATGPLAP